MDYGRTISNKTFSEEKDCPVCGSIWVPHDTRKERVCPDCAANQDSIEAVAKGRNYYSLTEQEKGLIVDRANRNRTVRGPHLYGRQYYIDKGLELPDAYK